MSRRAPADLMAARAAGPARESAGPALAAYIELLKPRVTLLVVLTALASGCLAVPRWPGWLWAASLALGTGLVAGGTAALNQRWEREVDARMRRTAGRPLPTQRLTPRQAAVFGLLLVTAGLAWLAGEVNPLTALLAVLTTTIYLLVYTPLKRRSPLSTVAGAFPGAGPVLMGWAAASGALAPGAWVLFAIQFFWQFPHFLAIAELYREDYQRVGICMLPVVDLDARATGLQMRLYTLALLPVSLLPAMLHLAGEAYFFGALGLGALLLQVAWRTAGQPSAAAALRLLRASVIYLPLLFGLLVFDHLR